MTRRGRPGERPARGPLRPDRDEDGGRMSSRPRTRSAGSRTAPFFSPAVRTVVPSLPCALLQWLELAAHNGLDAGSSFAGHTTLMILSVRNRTDSDSQEL